MPIEADPCAGTCCCRFVESRGEREDGGWGRGVLVLVDTTDAGDAGVGVETH